MQIQFNNVTKSYANSLALDNCSFVIQQNDFTALIGNNGCGKSTTINLLCNLANPSSGEYLFESQKVTSNFVSFKKDLGIILSYPYYVEEFNVIEYWQFVCKFQKVPNNEISKRIEDLVTLLELSEHIKKPIKELSSGNQMKVSFGAALIHNPKILILDEPFVNLDINTIERLIGLLKTFKGKKTIFITSHSLDLIADLCDNFLIMQEGKIIDNLQKNDYPDLETLKNHVKEKLTSNNEVKNIDWLK